MSNVYVLTTENVLKVDGKSTGHIYVIADSFESALKACRATYPEANVNRVQRMNSYNGLPVISAEGTAKSWGLL